MGTVWFNNKEDGPGHTTPVGQYSPAGGDSAYGVSDVAGNVWEWTLSKWGRDRDKPTFGYPYDHSDGREALEGAEFRVLRGGCFYDGAGWCSTSARYPNEPLLAADYIGFRVVRVLALSPVACTEPSVLGPEDQGLVEVKG